mgnify:CR=1 FL=1|tara:strand:- start:16309 stop:16533 length:225 start_codon:yes stop_codon:yes gene_type:complete
MPKLNSKKIKQLRLNGVDAEGKEITAFSLANELGVSDRVIYRLENDENYNPGIFTLLKVSEYFNVRIDDLIVKD